jgi:hypothetical protein
MCCDKGYDETDRAFHNIVVNWSAPGFEDTELGVLMGLEVDHGDAEVW